MQLAARLVRDEGRKTKDESRPTASVFRLSSFVLRPSPAVWSVARQPRGENAMPVEPRPAAVALQPVVHGSIGPETLAAHGLSPEDVVDFSVNTNPLGPPPGALAAVRALGATDLARYADPAAAPLRRTLAERLAIAPDQIVVGNGSAELIWLLALAFVQPAPSTVLIAGPTFGEYERASRLLGASVTCHLAAASNGFEPDLAGLAEQVRRERPSVVWLCNPNNPTGHYVGYRQIETLMHACVAAGTLLVVDEAYLAFVERPDSLLDLLPSGHLFLLRSMTKDYALAGLRLGYGLGTRQMVDLLHRVQPPWSVNVAAQVAGLASLADEAHLARARAEVWAARAALAAGIEQLGLRYVPPAANFLLVEVGNARQVCAQMLAKGFALRDCTSFGLPDYVRIGVRTRPECARLLAAMGEVLPARTIAPHEEVLR
jgi:histidinol-phosphate aminotransferase